MRHIIGRKVQVAIIKLPIAVEQHPYMCHCKLIQDMKVRLLKIKKKIEKCYLQLSSSWPALKCWFHTIIKGNIKVNILGINHFSITSTWTCYFTWTYAMKSSFLTISLWSLYSIAVTLLIMDLAGQECNQLRCVVDYANCAYAMSNLDCLFNWERIDKLFFFFSLLISFTS